MTNAEGPERSRRDEVRELSESAEEPRVNEVRSGIRRYVSFDPSGGFSLRWAHRLRPFDKLRAFVIRISSFIRAWVFRH